MNSLAARAERMAAAEAADVPLETKKLSTAKRLAAWKRITLTVIQILVTARSQMVVDHIVTKGNQATDEELENTKPPTSSKSSKKIRSNGAGDWQTNGQVRGAQEVLGGRGTMSTSQRCSSLPGKSTGQVVDMHTLRSSMVPTGRSSCVIGNHAGASGGCGGGPKDCNESAGLSNLSAATEREARAGPSRSEDGSRAHGDSPSTIRGRHVHWSQVFFGSSEKYGNAWEGLV